MSRAVRKKAKTVSQELLPYSDDIGKTRLADHELARVVGMMRFAQESETDGFVRVALVGEGEITSCMHFFFVRLLKPEI